MERVVLGEGTVVGPGTVIGSSAYEMAEIDGTPQLLDQAGGVRIGKGCVFLAGITIARSTFATWTDIGDYCSFDNLVHIAHDCVLGRGVKMTACSMLSGRVTLEDKVYIGPNATVSNGITVGAGALITIGSVVVSDVPAGKRVTGNFAVEHTAFKRHIAGIGKLGRTGGSRS
jgi:UDP-3-O-[3-hydroxymyristoyl] glucosamine N-acyltransferase